MIDLLIAWYGLGWAHVAFYERTEAHRVILSKTYITPANFVMMMITAPFVALCVFLFWAFGFHKEEQQRNNVSSGWIKFLNSLYRS